jgi:hypothetical protein
MLPIACLQELKLTVVQFSSSKPSNIKRRSISVSIFRCGGPSAQSIAWASIVVGRDEDRNCAGKRLFIGKTQESDGSIDQ